MPNGDATTGNVKPEEVEALLEGCNGSFLGRERETQVVECVVGKSQSLFCRGEVRAQDHEIVGITDGTEAVVYQTMVQEVKDDIGQQGGDNPALRCALVRGEERIVLPHLGSEEFAEDLQDITVGNPFGDQIDDEFVGDGVEEGLDVGVHHEGGALPMSL